MLDSRIEARDSIRSVKQKCRSILWSASDGDKRNLNSCGKSSTQFWLKHLFDLFMYQKYETFLSKQDWKYSFRKWIWTVCHFMKQKCYFQRGVAECRHAATPLSSYNINTTYQGFQKRYITLFYLKGLKSYQQKYKWKVRFTKESGVKCRHLNFDNW